MKNYILILISFFIYSTSEAKMIKVAIIDSGANSNDLSIKKCKGLDRDFTNTGLEDTIDHGSVVAAIVTKNLSKVNYCVMILKFYSPHMKKDAISTIVSSMRYAIDNHADIINISAGGMRPSVEEDAIFNEALAKGIIIVTAAGNDGNNLGIACNYYPLCYDRRILGVGSLNSDGLLANRSNYDSTRKVIRYYFQGEDVWIRGRSYSGTSFSAPTLTNRILKEGK